MQLVTSGEARSLLCIPPPRLAELPEKVQLVTFGEAKKLYIPPPRWLAELFAKVQLVTAGEEESLYIPPPWVVGPIGAVRVAAGDGEAVEDGAAVQGQLQRMVEDVVAVVAGIPSDPDVAAQDGDVVHPVAVLPADVAHGRVESAVEGHPVLQLEGRRAWIAWREFVGRRVDPLRHPDLIAVHRPGEGVLQVSEGILPGDAVVVASSILIHKDDIGRDPPHLIDPHVHNGSPVGISIHDAGIALEVVAGQVRRVVGAGIDARGARAEVVVAAARVHEQRIRIDVAVPGVAALDVADR